jgi:hypothetical protein
LLQKAKRRNIWARKKHMPTSTWSHVIVKLVDVSFSCSTRKKSSPKPKDSLLKNWYLYLNSWNLRSISFCNSFKEISILKKVIR